MALEARGADGKDADAANVRLRGSLDNCRIQFEQGGKGHVAFIGGSITEMNGYRPLVCKILQRRFPKTEFTFTDAGIASTCSTTGAFRLASDVLSKGPVDLLFIEFAVNDDQDAHHAARECIRGMEGIVRQTLKHNPAADIVITYFVNPEMLAAIQKGTTPVPVAAHEEVARHYGISTIYLAREVAQRIAAGTMTWEKFGGTHPGPAGNELCASMIDELMAAAWKAPLTAQAKKAPHPLPAKPLDELNYERGRFLDPKTAQAASGWQLAVPDWKAIKGGFRDRFAGLPLWCADKGGAELTLPFTGTAVGAYVLAGPDAGIVEASIDGGPAQSCDLFHAFSRGLHYPRTVMLAADLKAGPHTLKLRLSEKKNDTSTGTAARVLQFVAN
jgi:lysophospholipase L1-like esterase